VTRLFRSMKDDGTGSPAIGTDARSLGVRPGVDVLALAPQDVVAPGQGGMSVAPDSALNLRPYRRPPAYGGIGRDPVWEIGSDDLGPDLVYRPDPRDTGHGVVEPVRPMTLADYLAALAATGPRWQRR
jgi:hypothetical protein